MSENDRFSDQNPYRPPRELKEEEKKTPPVPSRIRFRAVIDEWFAIFQNKLGAFIRWGLLFLVILLAVYSSAFVFPFLEMVMPGDTLAFALSVSVYLILLVSAAAVIVWLYLGCLDYMLQLARGEEPNMRAVLTSRRFFFRGCVIFLCMFLVTMLVTAPSSVLLICSIEYFEFLQFPGPLDYILSGSLMAIQALMVMVCGFFLILTSVACCFSVDDDCGPLEAISSA